MLRWASSSIIVPSSSSLDITSLSTPPTLTCPLCHPNALG
jgi:hypothetical protein